MLSSLSALRRSFQKLAARSLSFVHPKHLIARASHSQNQSKAESARRSRSKHRPSSAYEPLEDRRVLSTIFPAWAAGEFTLGNSSGTPYGLQNTFQLESLPSSTKTVYLDFNGHISTNNSWNHTLNFGPYDLDGRAAFSNAELNQIQRIFQNVAEDFLPFNINVTTKKPSISELTRVSGSDVRFGIRVVMTEQTGGFGGGSSGQALIGSFTDSRDTPAFVFAKGGKNAADLAAHEVGHTLGLHHDGGPGVEYYRGGGTGATSWAPIMGSGYSRSLTQWNRGDYPGATNHEDDIAVISRPSNGVSLRGDDRGDSRSNAKALKRTGSDVADWGIIGTRGDVDFYRFQIEGVSEVALNIKTFQGSSNLDLVARLYNNAGNLISANNPTAGTSAAINGLLEAGTYYLTVDGVGLSGAYTDYGSLGFYSIKGSIVAEDVLDPVTDVGESGVINQVNRIWKAVNFQRTYVDPVVVAGPATLNGEQPATVRIRNVNSNGFEIQIDEWDYLDGQHTSETVGYLVMESGEHTLADGTYIIARNSFVNHEFRTIGFGNSFSSKPVVLTQISSEQGASAVTPRIRDVSRQDFEVRIQEEEGHDDLHSYEQVSWIAIDRGVAANGDKTIVADLAPDRLDQSVYRLGFNRDFGSTPVFLAGIQTYFGEDTANLRYRNLNSNAASLFVTEERSLDEETIHNGEVVGFVALHPGLIEAVANSSNAASGRRLPAINPVANNPVANTQPTISSADQYFSVLPTANILAGDELFETENLFVR